MKNTAYIDNTVLAIEKELPEGYNLVMLGVVGSVAHSYPQPNSDVDLHGVVLVPEYHYLVKPYKELIFPMEVKLDDKINVVLRDQYTWISELINHTVDANYLLMSQLLFISSDQQSHLGRMIEIIKETVNHEKLALNFLRMAQNLILKTNAPIRTLSPEHLQIDKRMRLTVLTYLIFRFISKYKAIPQTLCIVTLLKEVSEDTEYFKWLSTQMRIDLLGDHPSQSPLAIVRRDQLNAMPCEQMELRLKDFWSANGY